MLHDVELTEGSVVGVWKVGKFLGRGGQGAVWASRPTTTKRGPQRALKACFSTDPKDRRRFEREITLLKQCDSMYVVRILDSDSTWTEHVKGVGEFAYYVAEKCEGSLKDHEQSLGDVRSRLALFREAGQALEYLHSLTNPVIHRDIKPANFLIAQEPRRLVLADLGIAREEVSAAALTATQEVVGSRYFRAPEVLNGDPGSIASDVYSLGRLLEWLLTGDVSHDLGTRPIPRDGQLADDACDTLDRTIAKATQALAGNRFSSVKELTLALPQLWLSVKPHSKDIIAPSEEPEDLIAAALDIARAKDLIGWRQLEHGLRRTYVEGIRSWRREQERSSVRSNSDLALVVTDLVRRVENRIVFALVGVFTQQEGVIDQRRTIEDLMNVPDWNGSGITFAVGAPRGLVYCFHHLHGALCCDLARFDLALQVADARVPVGSRRGEELPLWRASDLGGWPELLGGNCLAAWEYLRSIPERFPSFDHFFALRRDVEVGLAGYSMMLSLLEAAYCSAELLKLPEERFADLRLESPAMFCAMPPDIIAMAFRRTLAQRSVVEQIAERARIKSEDLRRLWPNWKVAIQQFQRRVQRNRFFFDDPPLGELG